MNDFLGRQHKNQATTQGTQGVWEATEEDRCVAVRCIKALSLPNTSSPAAVQESPHTKDNEPAW